jgi:hypothetical protein
LLDYPPDIVDAGVVQWTERDIGQKSQIVFD